MKIFDYIIVGAGSAGCVLANRLSANSENRVLVIEAGGGQSDLRVKIPAGILAMYGRKRFDYGYVGTPQPALTTRGGRNAAIAPQHGFQRPVSTGPWRL